MIILLVCLFDHQMLVSNCHWPWSIGIGCFLL